jgi:uncharacterized protein YneF (UPF0154 family)
MSYLPQLGLLFLGFIIGIFFARFVMYKDLLENKMEEIKNG